MKRVVMLLMLTGLAACGVDGESTKATAPHETKRNQWLHHGHADGLNHIGAASLEILETPKRCCNTAEPQQE